MSYSVEQRTAEIGIRAALGASGGSLVGLIMRQATVITAAGLAIGLAAAVAAGNVLASLLFGVTPRDPLTLAAAPVALGLTALVAAWLPARRAASIDPIRALRTE